MKFTIKIDRFSLILLFLLKILLITSFIINTIYTLNTFKNELKSNLRNESTTELKTPGKNRGQKLENIHGKPLYMYEGDYLITPKLDIFNPSNPDFYKFYLNPLGSIEVRSIKNGKEKVEWSCNCDKYSMNEPKRRLRIDEGGSLFLEDVDHSYIFWHAYSYESVTWNLYRLEIMNDGNVRMYNRDNDQVIWQTGPFSLPNEMNKIFDGPKNMIEELLKQIPEI